MAIEDIKIIMALEKGLKFLCSECKHFLQKQLSYKLDQG